jgi:hypothetical protein
VAAVAASEAEARFMLCQHLDQTFWASHDRENPDHEAEYLREERSLVADLQLPCFVREIPIQPSVTVNLGD